MSPAARRSAPIKEEVVPPTAEELAEDAAAEAAAQETERAAIPLAAVQDPDVVDEGPEPEALPEDPEPEHVPAAVIPPSAETITLPDGRVMDRAEYTERLQLLTKPFRADEIEKLPKPVKRDDKDAGYCRRGTNYSADNYYCGKRHARSVHLDYVGHAGITERLNQVDPFWNWTPMARTDVGTPLFTDGGMWGELTVLGVTRIGFGDPGKNSGPNAIKETIGDFLRNAGMRFGIGTYLWSKSEASERKKLGELEAEEAANPQENPYQQPQPQQRPAQPNWDELIAQAANSREMLLDLLAKARGMGASGDVIIKIQETGMALDARSTEPA